MTHETGRAWTEPVAVVVFFVVFYALYFAPVWMSGGLLAPGDGTNYFLPAYLHPASELWSDRHFGGFPMVADLQAQGFYLPRLLSPDYNVLVVSAYPIQAVGTYGLARYLTGSRPGALVAALLASGGGFMVARLGHLSMIHPAAWLPWLLWALARQRDGWAPVALGAIAVTLCLQGGHPQVSGIALLLAGAWWLRGVAAAAGRHEALRLFVRGGATFALGAGLCGATLLPFLEAAAAGTRGTWSVADFDSYSHTVATLRILVLPALYGGAGTPPYGPYTGPWNLTELTLYPGIVTLFLASVASFAPRRDPRMWFFAAAAVVAMVLALGTATPLGEAVHHLPALGRFRAQARFGLIVALCVPLLAAYGVAALARGVPRGRAIAATATATAGFLAVVAWAWFDPPDAIAGTLLRAPAIAVPLALAALSVGAVALVAARPAAWPALALLAVVDVGSFGWVYEWRAASVPRARLALEPEAAAAIARIAAGPGRVLPLDERAMGTNPFKPNVNLVYGVSSAVGFNPLASRRATRGLGTDYSGAIPGVDPGSPALDVAGVRWIAGEDRRPLAVGSGCWMTTPVDRVEVAIPEGSTALRLVSNLGCASGIADGEAVARLVLRDATGTVLDTLPVAAGVHTAEWAWDDPTVNPSVRHARAEVAETFTGGGLTGHWYTARAPLPPGVASVAIAHEGPDVALAIRTVEAIDAAGRAVALAPDRAEERAALGPTTRLPGLPPFAERLGFRGMAWAVCHVSRAPGDAIAAIVRDGIDRAGVPFDPFVEAMVEPGFPFPKTSCAIAPAVRVIAHRPGSWDLEVAPAAPSLLVVSSSYHPGWRARVDGRPVDVIPVDGMVIGVPLVAKAHHVTLRFLPASFVYGLWLSGLSALVILGLLVAPLVRRRPRWVSAPSP